MCNSLCILLVSILFYNTSWGQSCNSEKLNQQFSQLAKYKKSLDFHKVTISGNRLIIEAKQCNNDSILFKSYIITAHCYFEMNMIDTALNMYQLAEKIGLKIKSPKYSATLFNDMGLIYYHAKFDSIKGIEYFKESIKLYEQIKDSSTQSLFPRYNVLNHYFELKNTAQFEQYVSFIKQSTYSKYTLDSTTRLTLLAQLEYMKKNYKKSLQLLNQINKIEKKHGYYSQIKMLYAKNYHALGDFDKAFNLMESLIKEQKIRGADDSRKTIKYQLLQIRNNYLESTYETETQRSKFIVFIFIILSVFLFTLSAFLFSFYKKNKEIKFKNSLLSKHNKEITELYKKLEAVISEKNKLISSINHELRTPIHGIMGLIAYAKEDVNTNFQSQVFNDIELQVLHLKDLIEDSLFINNSVLTPQYYPVEIELLIKNQVNLLSYLQKNCQIKITIEKGLEIINTDSQLLSVLIRKLVSNAFKFTTDGLVQINLRRRIETNEIDLEIKDTGIGIPEDKLNSVFLPFFQVNRTQKGLEGVGLGLAIVQRIANLFNGTIHLTSVLNQGTCFNILMPIIPFTIAQSQPGVKKFLIVEDNQINQFVLQKIIQKAGHQATIAENGQIAVECAKRHKFDFILMDINMPVMDGIEATKQIRSFDNLTPIIGVTALSDYSVQKQSFSAGMNKFITKPFDVNMFKNILNIQ